jgi:hypothetical protein
MKTSIQQVVVMSTGEVRIPTAGDVAHGHVPADEHIKITVPADRLWVLVEVEVEVEQAAEPGIASKIPR